MTTLPSPITRRELSDFLWSCGVQDCRCLDEMYALPSYEWMRETGAGEIWKQVSVVVGAYGEACADCDDYARAAADYMRWVHRWTRERTPGTAVAFCVWIYTRRDRQAHAINAFVYRDGGALKLAFLEPQTGKLIELTPEEISSCKLPEF